MAFYVVTRGLNSGSHACGHWAKSSATNLDNLYFKSGIVSIEVNKHKDLGSYGPITALIGYREDF